MADQGMYVANRDVIVPTDYGHMLSFKKGKAVYVPPLVREEVLKYGVLPVEGEIPVPEEVEQPPEPIGEERNRRIREAIKIVVERNDSGDFTAGGVPKEAVIIKEAGFRVARREINAQYLEMNAQAQE